MSRDQTRVLNMLSVTLALNSIFFEMVLLRQGITGVNQFGCHYHLSLSKAANTLHLA